MKWYSPPPRGGGTREQCGEGNGVGVGGQTHRLTHRVQLPLEYDESHKTDDDEYGTEAQVGKEVAREITWVRQEERDEDRAWAAEEGRPPASQ